MSSIKDALSVDVSGYVPVDKSTVPNKGASLAHPLEPTLNPFSRFPLPPMQVSPDSLRQFYQGGQVPQMRFLVPPNNVPGSNSGTTVNNTVITGGSGSTSSTTINNGLSLNAQFASITPILNPGDIFTGVVSIAKSFELISLAATSDCRVQLYATNMAQVIDSGRALDVAPPAGTSQDIITDVALDTFPYNYSWQNRIGHNGDTPQTLFIYVSITNLGAASLAIAVTVQYVALET